MRRCTRALLSPLVWLGVACGAAPAPTPSPSTPTTLVAPRPEPSAKVAAAPSRNCLAAGSASADCVVDLAAAGATTCVLRASGVTECWGDGAVDRVSWRSTPPIASARDLAVVENGRVCVRSKRALHRCAGDRD